MSNLTDNDFIQCVRIELERLDSAITKAIECTNLDLEINRDGGLLEIECENGSKIVITSQLARHEIWIAAKSGGFHFYFDAQQELWLNTRDQTELYQTVAKLITQQSNADFELTLS